MAEIKSKGGKSKTEIIDPIKLFIKGFIDVTTAAVWIFPTLV